MTVWINGRLSDDAGVIAPADRGFLLGDGLFETLPVRGGVPLFLADHMTRLAASAEVIGLPVVHDPAEIAAGIAQLGAAMDLGDAFSVRITVSRGAGPRGLLPPSPREAAPVTMITAAPAAAQRRAPMRLIVSSVRRNEGSPASAMKSLSYADNILARQEAARLGADEAVMLNNQGHVACASAANVFCVLSDEKLLTPSTACGVLPGIVRARIIGLARDAGIEVEAGYLQEEEYQKHPLFLTNSLIGVVPARSLEAAEEPAPPLVRHLADAYRDLVKAEIAAGREG